MPDFEPVNGDPFAPTLTPVNGDPFAVEHAIDAINAQTQAHRNTVEKLFRTTVGGPGTAAQPVVSQTPGMWSDEDEARRLATEGAATDWAHQKALGMIASPGVPKGAAGSAFSHPLYHGSPEASLSTLQESTRGPLGPGVYTSPAQQIAGHYAGDTGRLYELPEATRDIFRGAGHRTDEEWFGFKDDKARLLAAAEPEKREAISKMLDKTWSNDGYPLYQNIRRLYEGHEGAQALFKRAGFQGISGLVDGPETLLFGNQKLVAATPYTGGGIKAYHGSPHDFEKFDIGKIGTGEGAQAYGHGLYFAEHPKTAEEYRDALAGVNTKWMHGDQVLSGAEQNAAEILDRKGGDKEAALSWVKHALRPGRMADPKYLDETEAAINRFDPSKIKVVQDPGRMYEVNINADPEHFLDWDKPLSEQHPKVQEVLAGKVGEHEPLGNAISRAHHNEMFAGDLIGKDRATPDELIKGLNEKGIPGIKYLDQGSRGATEGQTHNYVVFHHDIVDILKKYGLAGLVAGGAAHFSTTPHNGDPFAQEK